MTIKTWGDRIAEMEDGAITTSYHVTRAMQDEIDELRVLLDGYKADPVKTKQFIENFDGLELTDAAIRKLQAQYPTENDPLNFARAIEAAIKRGTT